MNDNCITGNTASAGGGVANVAGVPPLNAKMNWWGTATCMILLLLFEGSGWYGFGNRYLLDLMPLAILLIAIGMGGRLTRVSIALIGLSLVVNAWGMYRFCAEQF